MKEVNVQHICSLKYNLMCTCLATVVYSVVIEVWWVPYVNKTTIQYFDSGSFTPFGIVIVLLFNNI